MKITPIHFFRSCCKATWPDHELTCPVGRAERGLSPGDPEPPETFIAIQRMRDENLTRIVI